MEDIEYGIKQKIISNHENELPLWHLIVERAINISSLTVNRQRGTYKASALNVRDKNNYSNRL